MKRLKLAVVAFSLVAIAALSFQSNGFSIQPCPTPENPSQDCNQTAGLCCSYLDENGVTQFEPGTLK